MWPRICESELANADPKLAEKLMKLKVEEVMAQLNDEEIEEIYNLSDILFIPQWFWLVCFCYKTRGGEEEQGICSSNAFLFVFYTPESQCTTTCF
jgi:hypothetical protein